RRGCVRRLCLTPWQAETLDVQGHAARALWNLLHEWWQWGGRGRRPTWRQADDAIRQARYEIPWLAELPAQAAQQVLKSYVKAWKTFYAGRSRPPRFKSRIRSRMAIDVPQGSALAVRRVNRRWGQLHIPKVGKVRFRWSGPMPGIGQQPGRISGARLIKEA